MKYSDSESVIQREGEKEQDLQRESEQSTEDSSVSTGDSFGKFTSAKALLNAYTGLEAEFTKRSQELRRLEKENSMLKEEQAKTNEENNLSAVASEPVQDETGSAGVEQSQNFASESSDEQDDIAREVNLFLERNPGAGKYAKEIALKTYERGEVDAGFLERAYIEVLQDELVAEQGKINDDFIYSRASENPLIKEKIIRDYLGGLTSSKGVTLLSQGGQTVIMPPKKPTSISEAGEMASKVLVRK